MQRTIQHQWHYRQSPQEVWDYLTRPELIAQWLMNNDFVPEVGREFMFTASPLPNFGFDGKVYCKVLEIEPCKKLSYTWKGGPGNGVFTLDSVVTWTLEEKDNGTQLYLVHSGLMEDVTMYDIMDAGWIKNIKEIEELLNA